MSYLATIDCGTTNSRVNILDENKNVIVRKSKKVGVKDTAISGTREVLREGLKETFLKALTAAGIEEHDIDYCFTSGMITSEIGLIEIPHLRAEAGINELAENIEIIKKDEVFPLDIPLVFIRGVKNSYPEDADFKDLREIDFMRGEEAQIIGLLNKYDDLPPPFTVIILSSHTKYINVDEEGKITGSLTTLSGQLYEAILEETSISKSVKVDDTIEELDEEVMDTAYVAVNNAGFVRSLLMPRFMEVLLDTTPAQRKIFLETAIASDDLITLDDFSAAGLSTNNKFVLVGQKRRSEIFTHLLENHHNPQKIKKITDDEEVESLSIEGALAIGKKAGII